MAEEIGVSVIGVGHLGREHARILDASDRARLTSLVDVDEEQVAPQAKTYGVPHYQEYERMLKEEDPEAVVVSVPTEDHYDVARECLEFGVDVLIEKPITRRIDRAQELVGLAEQEGVIIQVGHVERFNPAVKYLRNHVREPKFIECDRLSPFRFRSADIDVIQDVMIHDLDILRALVPGEIESLEGVGTSVITPHPDIANARLRFTSGCIANLSASRISLDSVRKLRVFTPNAYYSLDYSEKELDVYRASDRVEQFDLSDIRQLQEQASGGGEVNTDDLFKACLEIEQVVPDEDRDQEPLQLELDEFLESVRSDQPPEASGRDGVEALKLAKRIRSECEQQTQNEPQ